ncbi:MAG TPA: hypothetical protein VFR70_05060 [Flavobacterium sp.]|nr:hypothetical protein [Flavobacterium sp.]
MKKRGIVLVLALIFGLSFTSCNNDDDDSDSIGSVVGKWNQLSRKFSANGATVFDQPYDGHQAGCAKDYIEFFENGTISSGDYKASCVLETSSSSYTRSGNTLVIDNGEETYEIITANSSTMILRGTETIGEVTGTIELSFTKA